MTCLSHTSNLRLITFFFGGAILLTQTGCFTALHMLQQKQQKDALEASQAKFKEDVKKGDVAVLEPACQNLRYEDRRLSNEESNLACEALSEKLAARIGGIECDRVKEAWDASKRTRIKDKEPIFMATFERSVECKNWSYIFNDLVLTNYNGLDGKKLIVKLDEKGEPVEDLYLAEVKAKTLNTTGFDRYMNWRIAKDTPVSCDTYKALPVNGKVSATQVLKVLLSNEECTPDALELSVATLLDGNKFDRQFACKTIGEFGDTRHEEKLQTVYMYDKEWDVRQECDAALGKIKLRSSK